MLFNARSCTNSKTVSEASANAGLKVWADPRRDQENDEETKPLSQLVIALATNFAFFSFEVS
jgi:hypothetical protein